MENELKNYLFCLGYDENFLNDYFSKLWGKIKSILKNVKYDDFEIMSFDCDDIYTIILKMGNKTIKTISFDFDFIILDKNNMEYINDDFCEPDFEQCKCCPVYLRKIGKI